MRGIMIDPRLVTPTNDVQLLAAFRKLRSVFTRDPFSRPIRCIDVQDLLNAASSRAGGAAKAEMMRLMSEFTRYELSGTGRAAVTPRPAVAAEAWEEALYEETEADECAAWRTPWILVSKRHATEWPPEGDVEIIEGRGQSRRRLAHIETTSKDPEFWHDVDPWLFRCSIVHRPLGSELEAPRRDHRHCLPKPPKVGAAASWTELETLLVPWRKGSSWLVPGVTEYAYFIPSTHWVSSINVRTPWRGRSIFETGSKSTPAGRLNGPRDAGGRIWSWDTNENHWDVQHENEGNMKYWRVLPDGEVRNKS